jgi:hypothetical protein
MEATIPDPRANAAVQLADELGLSRSQLVDEALGLFLKVVLEVRRGRRVVTLDPTSSQPACELATPTLTALEWAAKPAKVSLRSSALDKMGDLIAKPPSPSKRLRLAAKRTAR